MIDRIAPGLIRGDDPGEAGSQYAGYVAAGIVRLVTLASVLVSPFRVAWLGALVYIGSALEHSPPAGGSTESAPAD